MSDPGVSPSDNRHDRNNVEQLSLKDIRVREIKTGVTCTINFLTYNKPIFFIA
jgi:hypothetical protein